MANTRRTKLRLLPACAAVVGLAALTACSGSGGGPDSGASTARNATGTDIAAAAAGNATATDIAAAAEVPLDERKLIKTGTVVLESNHVDRLLGELDDLVRSYHGLVDNEDVRTDDRGDAKTATIVVRVPVARFGAAVRDIADLGTLVREQTSSQDVTTRVVDVDARVESARRAIAQLRSLFDRAERLIDVIHLESELVKRQANLESLQAQQRVLARQTALSTINVSVSRTAAPAAHKDETGFVAGLRSGWSRLVAFVQGTAHLIGLVLPLGTLLVGAAIAVWVGVRRLRPPWRGRQSE